MLPEGSGLGSVFGVLLGYNANPTLMEVLDGYERAILIDAIQTGDRTPGTILELTANDLSRVISPSPHYAGIPEMLALAKQLEMDFPQDIRIYAIEVQDVYTFGGGLSRPVRAALDELTERICRTVAEWEVQHA